MSTKAKGNIILMITAMAWGTGFVAQKMGMDYVEAFTFNGIRQILGGLVLIPVAIYITRKNKFFSTETQSKKEVQEKWKYLFKSGTICGLFLCLATNMQQLGLETVSASKSGFITAIYIVLVPIVGIFFGHKVSKTLWGCVALAMFGFALLSLKGDLTSIGIGDIELLICSLLFAIQILAADYYVQNTDPVALATLQMLMSGIFSAVLIALFNTPTLESLSLAAPAIIYSALVPTAIGYTTQIIGQKYADPTPASLIMSLEAVFSAIFGYIILSESLTPREWLGCAVIFTAVVIAQLPIAQPRESGK